MKPLPRTAIPRSLWLDISTRARSRRAALELNFAEMAELVGVTGPTIARWESGDLPDSMRTTKLEAWEAALQAPVGWLLSPEDKVLPDPIIILRVPIESTTRPGYVEIPADSGVGLGLRARTRRVNLGLSRARICELIGVSVATLVKWERDELPRTLRADRLLAWENALLAPAGWLLSAQTADLPLPETGRLRVVITAETFADAIREIALVALHRGWDTALESIPLDTTKQRAVDLFSRRYGVSGPHGTTLTELAAPHGITRERVRQIVETMIERSARYEFVVPILESLRQACVPFLPCPAAMLTEKVRPLLGSQLTIEDACSFANDLLGTRIVRLSDAVTAGVGPRIERIACGLNNDDVVPIDSVKAMRSAAYAMIRSCGVAHMATVAGTVALEGPEDPSHVRALMSVEGFEWLDADKSWFWFGPETPSRNILLHVIRKVFSVARERVDISDLMAALIRYRNLTAKAEFERDRSLMLIPPVHIARAVLERIDWLEVVQHDDYRATKKLNPAEELAETEQRLVAELEKCGGVASRHELRTALPDVKLIIFSVSLSNTPTIRLVCRGIYALVGWPLNPTAFARAVSPSMANRIDVRLDPNGTVSFPWVLTEFAAESKACLVPAAGVPHIPAGPYCVADSDLTVDCVNRSSGATVINRLVQVMLAQGYDVGDVIRITIYTANRTIVLAADDVTNAESDGQQVIAEANGE